MTSPSDPRPRVPWLPWTMAGLALLAALSFAVFRSRQPDPARRAIPDIVSGKPLPPDTTLVISPDFLDFETIKLGERKTLTVSVENTGTEAAMVLRTIMGCTCLSGGLEAAVIPAGETRFMKLTFTGLPGRATYHTDVRVIVKGAKQTQHVIGVHGRIEQDFILEPELLLFGRVPLGETRTLSLGVRRRDGKPFAMKEVRCPRPEFSFETKAKDQKNPVEYTLTCTAKPARTQSIAENVQLVMDPASAGAPAFSVHLEGEGDVVFEPAVALPAPAPSGSGAAFEIKVRHKKGGALQVESVRESRDEPLSFEQATQPDGQLRVTLRFNNGIPAKGSFGEFQLKLAGEAEPLHIPYRFSASPAPLRTP